MTNDDWMTIQQVYMTYFNIPARVVDYMAVEPILHLCAEGRSNKYISRKVQLSQRHVKSVLSEFLEFEGWKEDLDISPLMVYDSVDKDWYYYRTTIKTVSSLTSVKEISLSYRVCRKYRTIRKEITKYVK